MVKAESKFQIEKVISQFKNGQMIIVVDDEDRENEGDFIIAAEKATPQDLNFMIREGRGLICMAIPAEYSHRLKLSQMVPDNTAIHQTNFTVSRNFSVQRIAQQRV